MMMKIKTRTALLFIALSAALAAPAAAEDQTTHHGRSNAAERFDKADTNKDGKISFEEFAASLPDFMLADTDKDGKVTVAELTSYLEGKGAKPKRAERRAKRIVKRYDANNDSAITATEIQSRQKKVFALLDKNDDGSIDKNEWPSRNWHHGKGHHKGTKKDNGQNSAE
jgi:Ca2+-binding EF-hand superfamily protein